MKKIFLFFVMLMIISTLHTIAQTINTGRYKLQIQKGSIFKKGSQRFCIIPVTFTNLSKDTLKYFSMACSVHEGYSISNEKMYILSNVCEKDFPIILKLLPGKSSTAELTCMIDGVMTTPTVTFKVGLNLIPANKPIHEFSIKEFSHKDNVIWSNVITL